MAKKPTKKESIEQDYDRWNTVSGTLFPVTPGQPLKTPRGSDFGKKTTTPKKPAAKKK